MCFIMELNKIYSVGISGKHLREDQEICELEKYSPSAIDEILFPF